MRLLYSALWWFAMPLVLLRLWRRGRKEPGYRQHVGERLGFYPRLSEPAPRFIWVHAVSVGETRAAEPLIDALLRDYPQHAILLTCMTATGRATGAQLFGKHGAHVVQSFLPYDTGWMCARFLRHFKPDVCVLMETEVWPNLVAQCKRYGVPVLLANARLSERSLRRGKRFASLLRPAAEAIDMVGAQSEADAARLREFGARHVEVTGSLKFDVKPPDDMVERGLAWKREIGARKVLLCVSTREGEEKLILDALAKQGQVEWLTVIVPRHPQRFDEVAEMICAHGLSFGRRSELREDFRVEGVDVMLGDSMGEMFAYYAACDAAFIGGSLLPLGGQNLIEAFALGKPVLIGPHTFNFQTITNSAIEKGVAIRVADAQELIQVWERLQADGAARIGLGIAAQDFAHEQQGATSRTIDLLTSLSERRAGIHGT
ncbi:MULTISPECIES: lipid IV(A) 3-deoxy-D-manno-octulosonic acid transferase [unclassified Herbaspirillum]|uniref:lipid IV(A) 3-deoxy-D-manno-octulosonic acid transferase n=1 Tax=unclassified Herbaspirillum TaxID=2624150 RepID=UPI001153C4D5|nr:MULTISPECIES: lipid IV(A) 3-deoxy-D-manno-octulosonic acid transferase [unclassified Herbaspirillum]MBB5392550.1 3-deoxy-D-manno-octulosonic-acid transferase [Herbaspirillum sp. SJZ102]TQK06187.1 3-deoxy-D-manno-octulosonic-acid transferase [Herbaspirillum sp. SJZ130]TQK12335.1 3-deoxy-D-manno-octulosonic-acid transferase [Herbaspirillum sp. SJZ106]